MGTEQAKEISKVNIPADLPKVNIPKPKFVCCLCCNSTHESDEENRNCGDSDTLNSLGEGTYTDLDIVKHQAWIVKENDP